ncbi:MAG: hypothetical protein ACE5O2_01765 [Armatimonadota bacterium]
MSNMRLRLRIPASRGVAALVATLWFFGCADQQVTRPDEPGITAAKGGTPGKPSEEDPTVESVDPSSAPQDTTLDVHVFGSGYDRGSKVGFERDGVAAEKVTTNSTKFVSSSELIANVTIAVDADTGSYDVAVTMSRGRKGIGTEMFEVLVRWENKPNYGDAISLTFADATGDNVTSDGRGSYVDRQCGVSATFNLTDARLDPDANKIHPKEATACGGRDARKVMVSFTDRVEGSPPHYGGLDGQTVGGNFMLVHSVETVTEADGTVLRGAVIHGAGCGHGLRFTAGDPNSDPVAVTKNGDGTWTIQSQAPTLDADGNVVERNDVAVCIPDEHQIDPPPRSYYHMPFRITVRLKQ